MIIGLIDARKEEISFQEVIKGKGTFDEGLRPLVIAIAKVRLNKEKSGISASQLGRPWRQIILSERYDVYSLPEMLIDSWEGTVLHEALSQPRDDDIIEKEFRIKIDEIVISGHPDRFSEGTIYDFKWTTSRSLSRRMKFGWGSWGLQLNCYKLLMECSGYEVNGLMAVVRLKDKTMSMPQIIEIPEILDFRSWLERFIEKYLKYRDMDHLEIPCNEKFCSFCPYNYMCDISFSQAQNEWLKKQEMVHWETISSEKRQNI